MARCKECMHHDVCSKEGRMVQVDEHTWDDYNQLDDVERFCDKYIAAADVVPKSEVDRWRFQLEAVLEEIPETKREVAREIFEEIGKIVERYLDSPLCNYHKIRIDFAELEKKYTEDQNNEN